MGVELSQVAVQQMPAMLNRYGGPVGVLGKLVGLGGDEVDAGVPWWSWLGVGVVVGSIVAYTVCERIK